MPSVMPPEQREDHFYRNLVDNLYDGVYFVDRQRRISYWNRGAERITGFTAGEVVGRRCMDNILNHIDGQGRILCRGMCPLAQTMADGRVREAEVFFHHKDGQRQAILVRTAPIRDPGGQIIGGVEIFNDNTHLVAARQKVEELQRLALFDPLTEVGNRRYLTLNVESRLEELRRYAWPFALLFVDIDRFKLVNDRHGHETGDRMLKAVARTLSLNCRATDLVGRWGGEEFLVLLGNADRCSTILMAERLRALVEHSTLTEGSASIGVTVSIGGTLALEEDSFETLLERADALMYRSKEQGRNRVTLELGGPEDEFVPTPAPE